MLQQLILDSPIINYEIFSSMYTIFILFLLAVVRFYSLFPVIHRRTSSLFPLMTLPFWFFLLFQNYPKIIIGPCYDTIPKLRLIDRIKIFLKSLWSTRGIIVVRLTRSKFSLSVSPVVFLRTMVLRYYFKFGSK